MIAVDANGADQGPGAVAAGVARSGLPVLLFGPAEQMRRAAGPDAELVHAPESIKAGGEALGAVRSRPDASIVQAAAAVADGRADALVSAGSTGPTLAAATLALKRMHGVFRPALAVLLPVPGGPVLLLDAGANVEVRPEHLVQFAYMGACFMEAVVESSARGWGCCRSARSPARARPTCSPRTSASLPGAGSTSSATSRASTCRARAPTWWWPTASPGTLR